MTPSLYEPGNPPDDDLCIHGKPHPCPYCRFEAACDKYDMDRKDKHLYWSEEA